MIVTLLTDFGLRDTYVAEMKGVILSHSPDASIVDISHDVEKFNVHQGAYFLARSIDFFPVGTIHLAVVDPEVGSARRPIAIETTTATLIGPDNGLLFPAAKALGIRRCFLIENKTLLPQHISSTFHGRDIFAHAAGYIASGMLMNKIGREISDIMTSNRSEPRLSKYSVEGAVIHVDSFGNIVTNITLEALNSVGANFGKPLRCLIDNKPIGKLQLLETYSKVGSGSSVAVIGSSGFIEVSINQGNAAEQLGVKRGQTVLVEVE
ncbi:MAG: S-adenosyl-l-methionine hydroxide adenosyltransferase family protein [Candidatus Bathyarchaeia archaeon]